MKIIGGRRYSFFGTTALFAIGLCGSNGGLKVPGKARGKGCMVGVAVGKQNMAHGPRANGFKQTGKMCLVIRPGVDNHNLLLADKVGIGAAKGKNTGVAGCDSHNIGVKLDGFTVMGQKIFVECNRHGFADRYLR